MALLKFGDCVLDPKARQLFRSGQPVHLSPKAFELLTILVAEQPRAVSKAELHDRIWPGTFVTDDSLSRLVSEARTAIGDHQRTPGFVRTVHGFGYGFSSVAKPADGPTEANSWLVFNGRAIVLHDGANLIGRDPAARLVLESTRVSRRHAQITIGTPPAIIEDLGSRNGTWLNGASLHEKAALTDGDEIGIGGFVLRFRVDGASASTEADD